jgi:hypothetical protein
MLVQVRTRRAQPSEPRGNAAFELYILIDKQKDLAAQLARDGKDHQARIARGKLLVMLNQLELVEELSSEPNTCHQNCEGQAVRLGRER